MRPSVSSPRTRSLDSTAERSDRPPRPATPTGAEARSPSGPHEPDAHPRGIQPVAHRLGQPREQVARLDGLLESRAELAQHRQLALAVAEDGAMDPPLHPRAQRKQADREQRRDEDRRHDAESTGEQDGGRGDGGRVDDGDEQVRRARDDPPAIARGDVECAVAEDAVDRGDRQGDQARRRRGAATPQMSGSERQQHERQQRGADGDRDDARASAHLGLAEQRTGCEHPEAEGDHRPRLVDEEVRPRGPPTRATAPRTGWRSRRR